MIFNHLEKTAGQSLHELLKNYIGDDLVTPLFSSFYENAIYKLGARYPIIFGHLQRLDDDLDLTYEHVTILREPTDRLVSWLNYLLDHLDSPEPHRSLAHDAKNYLESEGDILGSGLKKTFNLYMQRFVGLHKMYDLNRDERIKCALNSLEKYNLFGYYEKLDEFTNLLQNYIGIQISSSPVKVKKINTTNYKIRKNKLSSKILKKMYSDNEDDYIFYKNSLNLYETKKRAFNWSCHNKVRPLTRTPNFKYKKSENVVDFRFEQEEKVIFGEFLRIKISFQIKNLIEKKVVGISVRNEQGRVVYGTNSNLMGLSIPPHSLIFSFDVGVQCHFPCGKYYFGVALVDDQLEGDAHHIFWDDAVFQFDVVGLKNGMPHFDIPVKSSWQALSQ